MNKPHICMTCGYWDDKTGKEGVCTNGKSVNRESRTSWNNNSTYGDNCWMEKATYFGGAMKFQVCRHSVFDYEECPLEGALEYHGPLVQVVRTSCKTANDFLSHDIWMDSYKENGYNLRWDVYYGDRVVCYDMDIIGHIWVIEYSLDEILELAKQDWCILLDHSEYVDPPFMLKIHDGYIE